MNTTSLTCEELVQCLSQGAVLVDVMTPEDFAAAHVIGDERQLELPTDDNYNSRKYRAL